MTSHCLLLVGVSLLTKPFQENLELVALHNSSIFQYYCCYSGMVATHLWSLCHKFPIWYRVILYRRTYQNQLGDYFQTTYFVWYLSTQITTKVSHWLWWECVLSFQYDKMEKKQKQKPLSICFRARTFFFFNFLFQDIHLAFTIWGFFRPNKDSISMQHGSPPFQ